MTQRYKITVEYDGTDLLGWQKQLDGPSAQEFLEKAVEAFCQEKTEVYGAGRTDAGVHALAQVAHFDLNREVDPFRLREAVNAHLRSMEAPVSVLAAEKTAPDFHARYSAVGRAYIYRITNRRAPLVIDKNRSWPVVARLISSDIMTSLPSARSNVRPNRRSKRSTGSTSGRKEKTFSFIRKHVLFFIIRCAIWSAR